MGRKNTFALNTPSILIPKLQFWNAIGSETHDSQMIHKQIMRSKYKIIDNESIYFLTSTTVEWIPVFTSEKYFDIIVNAIKFYQSNNSLEIYCYVLLDNHFHLISSGEYLSKTIASLKSYTAK